MSIVSEVKYQDRSSWIPSIFQWQDKLEDGSETNVVRSKLTGETYGGKRETAKVIRLKFFELLAGIPLYGLVRIAYRIGSLVSKDFIKSAAHKAKEELKNDRHLWVLKKINNELTSTLPPTSKFAAHLVIQLAKNVVKIATLPLALVLMELSALYGQINPLDGRVFFSLVEHAWSRDVVTISSKEKWREQRLRVSDYMATCMQPKSVAEKRNLFKLFPDSNPKTLRTLLVKIEQRLEISKEAFHQENEMDMKGILSSINHYKKNIKMFSYSDSSEVTHNGELYYTGKEKDLSAGKREVALIRQKLIESVKAINQIQNARVRMADLLRPEYKNRMSVQLAIGMEKKAIRLAKEALAKNIQELNVKFKKPQA